MAKKRTCRVATFQRSVKNSRRYYVTTDCGRQLWMETARPDGPKWTALCPCLDTSKDPVRET